MVFEIFSCQIASPLCLIMEWKYPSSLVPLSVPQYILLIPSFNSCKTWLLIHPPPILKENLNMRRKEEPEKTDNIYAVCLRKSRVDSQLKEQKWVWKKALCVWGQYLHTLLCKSSVDCPQPSWVILSSALGLFLASNSGFLFPSYRTGLNFVFALKIVSFPLKRGQKPRETRLFAWLMVKE